MENIKPIRTEADYDWALGEVEPYFINPPHPDTAAADRFDLLCDLISAYEAKHHVLPDADPIELIKETLFQRGMNQNDLVSLIGHKSKVSEVLNRKRRLTLAMIQQLNATLNIPADALIKPYPLAVRGAARNVVPKKPRKAA